jgi:hypothetical protein
MELAPLQLRPRLLALVLQLQQPGPKWSVRLAFRARRRPRQPALPARAARPSQVEAQQRQWAQLAQPLAAEPPWKQAA